MVLWKYSEIIMKSSIFSSPGRSPGRAIVLPSALTAAALSGELSCPGDRSC